MQAPMVLSPRVCAIPFNARVGAFSPQSNFPPEDRNAQATTLQSASSTKEQTDRASRVRDVREFYFL